MQVPAAQNGRRWPRLYPKSSEKLLQTITKRINMKKILMFLAFASITREPGSYVFINRVN
ncbi:hypothetical protein HYN43_009015 [Mucilaginibacter celer]|uniref:Uncharacterized protein n=1 Tax=Mucilaginibacter celer TaxID=2305508 RepID=A0A494VLK5_9SPHI|nr:hypothetical protein HYN43_009015 [Mucilaginibacter celer]